MNGYYEENPEQEIINKATRQAMLDDTFAGTQNSFQDENFMRFVLETKDIIEELELNLLGKTRNDQQKIIQKGKALMNKDGVYELMNFLKPRLKRTMFLGNIKEKERDRMCMELRLSVNDWVLNNYKNHSVGIGCWEQIIHLIDHAYFLTLSRALDNGERRAILPNFKRVEGITRPFGKQNKGVII
ncbi:hypothetical protein KY333_04935 [Candidatus Woesearchaeota archaeon]|nr:hypothetical protein [Candidatus Woesearchaeota archaeon]